MTQHVSSNPITPNFDSQQIDRYLTFLSGGTDKINCYWWGDKDSNKPLRGLGNWTASASKIEPYYANLSVTHELPTLHVTLNEVKISEKDESRIVRRTAKDMVCPRVFCVDIDTPRTKEQIRDIFDKFGAQLAVESSPGKFHVYWKCAPSVPLKVWSSIQAGLAEFFGGDRSLADVTHCVRVPGVARITKQGILFMPHIVKSVALQPELDLAGMILLIPNIVALGEKGMKAERAQIQVDTTLSDKLYKAYPENNGHFAELARELGAQEGKRNNRLYKAIRTYVTKASAIDESMTLQFARSANMHFSTPLEDEEVRHTAESAWKRGNKIKERQVERAAERVAHSHELLRVRQESTGITPFQYDESAIEFITDRFTEASLCERVLQRFKTKLTKIDRTVFAFNDTVKAWKIQKTDTSAIGSFVDIAVQDTITDPRFDAELCTKADEEVSDALRNKWVRHFTSNHLHSSTVKRVLQSSKITEKSLSDFDAAPFKLYCANGVVDLVSKEIREAQPDDYLMQRTQVIWNPTAECHWWLNFIKEVFSENQDPEAVVNFIQELFGYSLTGLVSDQRVYVHWGAGCNGKSKVLETLLMLMGGYGGHAGGDTASKNKKSFAKELNRLGAKFDGKRVVVLDDLASDTEWNEGFIKSLTAPTITARKLYEEEYDIPNRAKFHIGCNTSPAPETENDGIMRRICRIPYPRKFEQDKAKEEEIGAMVRKELSGIFNWAIEGLARVTARGGKLITPNEVLESIQEYREEHSPLENAINKLCIRSDSKEDKATIKTLAIAVNAELNGSRQVSEVELGRKLNTMKFENNRERLNKNSLKQDTVYYIKLLDSKTG